MEVDKYSPMLSELIYNLSKAMPHAPAGLVSVEEDEGRRVQVWGTVGIVDKQNELVDVESVLLDIDKYKQRGGDIFYNHMGRGGQKIGKLLNYKPATWKASDYPERAEKLGLPPDFERPGVILDIEVFPGEKDVKMGRKIDDIAWKAIKAGELPQVSIGGKSHAPPVPFLSRDTEGIAIKRGGISIDEWAFVPEGANELSDLISINDKQVLKDFSNGKDIDDIPELHKLQNALEAGNWSYQDSVDIVKSVATDLIEKGCGPVKSDKSETKEKEGSDMSDDKDKKEDVEVVEKEYITKDDFDKAIADLKKEFMYANSGGQGSPPNPPAPAESGSAMPDGDPMQHFILEKDTLVDAITEAWAKMKEGETVEKEPEPVEEPSETDIKKGVEDGTLALGSTPEPTVSATTEDTTLRKVADVTADGSGGRMNIYKKIHERNTEKFGQSALDNPGV